MAVIAAVRKAGVVPVYPIIPEVTDGPAKGLKAIYIQDPDGIVIEFMEDPRFASE
jgi:hypothetical protein